MSVTIGDIRLNYKINGNKYITSFISEYPPEIDTRIDQVFNQIFPLYYSRHLEYSNVCGPNSDYICKKVKIDGITFGKLIITFQQWRTQSDRAEAIKTISDVYGSTVLSIGSTYHALAYFETTINDKKYYVAIETTICEPYKLQFYVGTTPEEFKTILTTRYQCNDFAITFECDKYWMSFMNGGSRVESGDKSRRFQSLPALPALKHDTNHGSPTALAVGDFHNLSSFSSLGGKRSRRYRKSKKSRNTRKQHKNKRK